MRPAVHSCNEGNPNHKEPDTCEVRGDGSDLALVAWIAGWISLVVLLTLTNRWTWPPAASRSTAASRIYIPIIGMAHRCIIPAAGAGRARA